MTVVIKDKNGNIIEDMSKIEIENELFHITMNELYDKYFRQNMEKPKCG